MSGPWEEYRVTSNDSGPWQEFDRRGKSEVKPVTIGVAGMGEAIKAEYNDRNWADRQIIAGGTALSNLWEAAKQILPGMKADDQTVQANRIIAKENPGASFAGNVALAAPTAVIPGANTYTGSALIGSALGLLQPTQGDESRLTNTAAGAAGGVVGQKLGNMLSSALTKTEASEAAKQGRNTLRDSVLTRSQEAGYVLPKSEVNPGFISNRLESLAGKAALKQDSALKNQEVSNKLARQLIGLSDDQPLSGQAVKDFRKVSAEPYRQISAMDDRAAAALEALKKVRNESQAQWNYYNRSANPDALNVAKALDVQAKSLEDVIETVAKEKGTPGMVDALKESRKKIAQSYTLQRALNETTGDVSAPVLGRILAKGKPMSDELRQIAEFQQAFPKFAGEGAKTPPAGVGKTEMLAAALLGGGGVAGTDSPMGAVAGVLPFLSQPARAALLSKQFQKLVKPSYGPGIAKRIGGAVSDQLPVAGAYGALEALGQ
jgi:hypothetical protein